MAASGCRLMRAACFIGALLVVAVLQLTLVTRLRVHVDEHGSSVLPHHDSNAGASNAHADAGMALRFLAASDQMKNVPYAADIVRSTAAAAHISFPDPTAAARRPPPTPQPTPTPPSLPEPIAEQDVACFAFKTKDDCMAHADGRAMEEFNGFRIRHEPCMWCCGHGCSGPGTHGCEPHDFARYNDFYAGGMSVREDDCATFALRRSTPFVQAQDPGDEPSALDLVNDLELDPRTKLQVPRFWVPPPSLASRDALDAYVHTLNGQPSIMLMIASYRDFQCRETIASALERAEHPKRVVIGAVEQFMPGDVPCDVPPVSCELKPEQALCKHKARIRVYKMDASLAEGPVYARHLGDRMYRGEAYRLQVDAHVEFVNGWDTKLIEQFRASKNEYAILSTYLTDVQESIDSNGDSRRNTRPIMCSTTFQGQSGARYLRHLAQPEERPRIRGVPMLHPFWAAGMSFSRGHVAYRVPYDCCAPQVFQGEEISMAARLWTHGYDLYAPERSVFFHEYASKSSRRKKVHFFTESSGNSREFGSLKRLTSIIGMNPEAAADPSWDRRDLQKYNLGTERPIDLYYKLIGVDVHQKAMHLDICKFVTTGLMHRKFSPYLRSNGKGIDYSGDLATFDPVKALNEYSAHTR